MKNGGSFFAIFFAIVLVVFGVVFFALRSADSHLNEVVSAIRTGLERAYDKSIAKASAVNSEKPLILPIEVLRDILVDSEKRYRVFPSVVDPRDVFIAGESVAISSDDLVCVVRLNNGKMYGITGRRSWREVSGVAFGRWRHEPLVKSISEPK